jgi:phospholipase D1/2
MSKSSRKDNQKGILTPVSWAKSHEPKWFIVRESYIVVVDEPDELQVYDVFLIDGDFAIERPKRFYKQTIHLASELASDDKDKDKNGEKKDSGTNPEHAALLTDGQYGGETGADDDSPGSKSVSSHTFYIRNAQQRLRLVAKTERLMRQFIGSLERVAARNIFVSSLCGAALASADDTSLQSGSNRFGSFAPIRLNCSAQWLIDGRDYFWNLSKALLMAKDRIFIHDWCVMCRFCPG